jgi:hypothetical protein
MSNVQPVRDADPWFDLEGKAARMRRIRRRRMGDVAFLIAILALILVVALWVERLVALGILAV